MNANHLLGISFVFAISLEMLKSEQVVCLPDLSGGIQSLSEKNAGERGLVYECVKCGAKVALEELELRGGGVKCTYCGYRVLRKLRPPVVKRIKAK